MIVDKWWQMNKTAMVHQCNDQERPQTARRNLTHQQSVEGEVTIAFFIPGVQSSNASYTQLWTARSSTTCKHTPIWTLPEWLWTNDDKWIKHQWCTNATIKNVLRQPVAIWLISNQWKEKSQLRFSSQAFEVPMPLTLNYVQLDRVLLANILQYERYQYDCGQMMTNG